MATEYWQFAGTLVFFLGLLIGSYWFVYVPNRGEEKRDEKVEAGGCGLPRSVR